MISEVDVSDRRILIVGSGSIAKRHARVLHAMGVEDIHHLSRSGRPLDLVGPRVIEREASDVEFREFDLVVVASATQHHLEDSLAARSWGAQLLIEKPLSATADDIETFAEMGWSPTQAFVSFPLRFKSGLLAVKAYLEDNIAVVDRVSATCRSWLPEWREGRDYREGYWSLPGSGGVLFELIHEPDYLWFLFGHLEFLHYEDRSQGVLGLDLPESVSLRARTAFNQSVDIHLDWCTREPTRKLEIEGVDRYIAWDLLESTVSLSDGKSEPLTEYDEDQDRNTAFAKQYQELFEPGSTGSTLCSLTDSLELHRALIDAMATKAESL